MSHPMTTLSLFTALRLEESRTGERVLPEWLQPHKYDGLFEQVDDDGTLYVSTDAASAIILGSMAAWCSGRGYFVYQSKDGGWKYGHRIEFLFKQLTATDALSAFGEATLSALKALETKTK